MIQTKRCGNGGERQSFSIRTHDNPARLFIFIPTQSGMGLLASRHNDKGTICSVTGDIDRNDIIELITFLLAYAMGTEYGTTAH